eukprot:TRINITY_DN29297_c0_g1_i2.p1 TRINITY_DN29297_c0_g1~~TRINITY_DN29297_c0_g1_i2.p1  ORF type:complete len:215 (-),score=19.04 TRINITY_DN29297_c0_g1_i2:52-696(-)
MTIFSGKDEASLCLLYAATGPRDALAELVQSWLDDLRQALHGRCGIAVGIASPESFYNPPSRCQLLHLVGHTAPEGFIVEQTSQGHTPALAPWPDFVHAISESEVKFLFLNACSTSAVGEEIAKQGGASVLCHQGRQRDDVGALFTPWFYNSFAAGLTVKEAYQQTCTQIDSKFGAGASKSYCRVAHERCQSTLSYTQVLFFQADGGGSVVAAT